MVDSPYRAAYKSAGIRDQIGLIHYWNWAWSDGCSPLTLRLDVPVMDFRSSFGLSLSPLLELWEAALPTLVNFVQPFNPAAASAVTDDYPLLSRKQGQDYIEK